tara:strand:- start:1003 stop:1278 length:276 start_codon:yes stop_codon:yes gene_type:complete
VNKVIIFFKDSHRSSPLAFYCEMVEALFLITASAVLSFTILDPATTIFVPMYLLGSILGIISGVIRGAAFVVILCSWFTLMNIYALAQLFL